MRLAKYSLLIVFSLVLFTCYQRNNPSAKQNPYPDNYESISSLKNRQQWNTANIHDPSCIKVGDTYYVYSTDAYYIPSNTKFKDDSVALGNIPIRSSKDLVHWTFEGWVFDSIPQNAFRYVTKANDGKTPGNIWAPYIFKADNEYRLYYSVSYFGSNASYIGMAVSKSPLGPWVDKGEVVKTDYESPMNAIDPTVTLDHKTGKLWMIYGSYFGGLYAMELDANTGLAMQSGDNGHLLARRSEGKKRIIEAPEIMYNDQQKMYYLFVSYDPLFTYYNIRVGRAKSPEGPFLDYFGNDLRDTTNNYPILTHSYRFQNHPGWSGNAHCSVLNDNGKYFVMHQGRLAPDNLMMRMQVREIKWLSNGWPVFSPERYNPVDAKVVKQNALVGNWELIELKELPDQVELWQGQIPGGGWHYTDEAFNLSQTVEFTKSHTILGANNPFHSYRYTDGKLYLSDANQNSVECAVFYGWDWENECETILLSGILPNGHGLWGKMAKTIQ